MTQAEKQRQEYRKQHSAYERRIKPIFLNTLRRQIEPVVIWLDKNPVGDPPLELLIDAAIFRRPMVQSYQLVGMTSAKRSYYQIRGNDGTKTAIDFFINLWADIFREYALRYAYRIENELSDTTKEEIRKALSEGRELGYSNDRIATLIRRRVQGQISRTRAILIARTEATTASNLGAEQGAKTWLNEVNQKGYQQWISRVDEETRHNHLDLNEDIIPMGEQWEVGTELADMPGDTKLSAKERCNCRCTRLFMSERRYLRLMAEKK